MDKKRAFITVVNGQDGSYLAELLLDKGYDVWGLVRRASSINTSRINHLITPKQKNFHLVYGDMTDSANLTRLIQEIRPDEIYNLAAQSHVKVSFEMPEYTANSDAIGPLRMLEAIKTLGLTKKIKFYQASTSELYGMVQETPQAETTPFYPRSPYGVAKLYAYWITVNYREAYGIYACNGILFNHESPRRGETFVTRKITKAVAAIKHGQQSVLKLGNLNAKRDWGHARDYVEGMWRMLQQEQAEDFVLATGQTHTVRAFAEKAFAAVEIPLEWEGEGLDEVGRHAKTGEIIVQVDPQFFRPAEVDLLIGDPSKALEKLDWQATTSLDTMIEEMVQADLKAIEANIPPDQTETKAS